MNEKGMISHLETSPQYTDVKDLNPDKLYAVAWKANPEKIAALQSQGVNTYSHTGAYYNGSVWYRNGGTFYTTLYKTLDAALFKGGYTVGPIF